MTIWKAGTGWDGLMRGFSRKYSRMVMLLLLESRIVRGGLPGGVHHLIVFVEPEW